LASEYSVSLTENRKTAVIRLVLAPFFWDQSTKGGSLMQYKKRAKNTYKRAK
jgi:hypothetical protein